jgi:hypothetical protein
VRQGVRSPRIFRVHPDGAAEAIRGVWLEPAVQQPVVDRGTDPAVEQIIGNVAARQRVQHRVIDAGTVEQMPSYGLTIRSRVVLAVKILSIVSSRCLVPLRFDIGDGPQFVRGREIAPDFGVIAEMRLHVGIDDHAVR